ncbi:hypothetical protein Tco_0664017 [Tanacetum coccineum]
MPKSAWTKKDLIDNFLKERRFYTSAGNPVKEILLKLNLPDHRILKDGGEGSSSKELKTKTISTHNYVVNVAAKAAVTA